MKKITVKEAYEMTAWNKGILILGDPHINKYDARIIDYIYKHSWNKEERYTLCQGRDKVNVVIALIGNESLWFFSFNMEV